jgi:hypothetical protein
MPKYYKFLTADGTSPFRKWQWPLPTQNEDGSWTPGDWTPVVETIKRCSSGYHACEARQIAEWVNEHMYELEFAGKVESDDEVVHKSCYGKAWGQQARLLRRLDGWNGTGARLYTLYRVLKMADGWMIEHPKSKLIGRLIEWLSTASKGEEDKVERPILQKAMGRAIAESRTYEFESLRYALYRQPRHSVMEFLYATPSEDKVYETELAVDFITGKYTLEDVLENRIGDQIALEV